MRTTIRFAVLILALFSANVIVTAAPNGTTYSLTINEDDPRRLKVEARFVLRDPVLYMDEYGGNSLPKRWAQFVENLSVTDASGNSLVVKELGDAKWRVTGPENIPVVLRYSIVLDHEKHTWAGGIDGVAFARDWGVFYTGRTFLVMNGKELNDVRVNFVLPRNWKVTAGWENDPSTVDRFIARNKEELLQSMFFAGTHREFKVTRDGFELVFALGSPAMEVKEKELHDLAKGVLDQFIKLMGGAPKPPPERRFKKSVVIINAGKQVDGEVIGNHISMILDPAGDPQSKMIGKFIFAHEFFHLWNGKSINVASTKEDWFKEGVTNYYTIKTLKHIGAISEQEYLWMLAGLFYGRYSSDPGLGKLSMLDVASGADKDKHWGMIYGGGMFVGICQDINIRLATNNRKSLDDIMRQYYRSHAGSARTYTTDDMQAAISRFSESDQSEFFRQYVYGSERVPIEQCLSRAGFDAAITDGRLTVKRNVSASNLEKEIADKILGL